MKSNRIAIGIMAILLALGGVVYSQNRADQLYEEGRQLLSQERWPEAAGKFSEAFAQGGERADASLYWKAYAQEKQGLRSETLATLQDLFRAFPDSRWTKEAKALELKARSGSGLPVQPEQEADEDLKLIAINSLLNSDPERAVPLLEKVLQSNPSARLKKKALFVLAQSGAPKAREIIERIARDGSNPEMQKAAIQHLGVFGGPENRALLSDIYASSNDVGIKKRVLHSFMVAGERQRVVTAAESEKDAELRREAVQLLGVMGAREDLWRMYQRETGADVKKRIINALFVAGDHERMGMLANSEQSPELRMEAVEKLGLMGQETAPQLKALYADSASDAAVKQAVLKAFFLQGNAQALVEVARTEKDPDLKKRAVRNLSLMNSKEATDFMLEILNQ
jgi:HEAT repeat protein